MKGRLSGRGLRHPGGRGRGVLLMVPTPSRHCRRLLVKRSARLVESVPSPLPSPPRSCSAAPLCLHLPVAPCRSARWGWMVTDSVVSGTQLHCRLPAFGGSLLLPLLGGVVFSLMEAFFRAAAPPRCAIRTRRAATREPGGSGGGSRHHHGTL